MLPGDTAVDLEGPEESAGRLQYHAVLARHQQGRRDPLLKGISTANDLTAAIEETADPILVRLLHGGGRVDTPSHLVKKILYF